MYNTAELFDGINSFDKNLLFIEKGQRKFFCLAAPLKYNDKLTSIVPVQGHFKGQPNKNPSILLRCFEVPLMSNGTPDFDNAKFVCLVTNIFVASKLRECFLPGTVLVKRPNLLPDENNNVYLFMLSKPDKNTEVTFSSVAVKLPLNISDPELPTWETLVEEHDGMQQAMQKKYSNTEETKKEDALW